MNLDLLLDIAKCNEFCGLIENENITSSCHKVYKSQKDQGAEKSGDFQLPEPWSGDILNAPILIISSNPSYSSEELYPDLTWPNEMILDFFQNRFHGDVLVSWVFLLDHVCIFCSSG